MTTRSFVIQRATTGEILTRDGALRRSDREGPSWSLSAPGTASFTTAPHMREALASDGRPLFEPSNTIVTMLVDGEPEWRGLLVEPEFEGPQRTLTFDSLTAYPHGIIYLGDPYYGAKVDPADIMRLIWRHVQSYTSPASDLGVQVAGSTNLRIGSFSSQNKQDTLDAYNKANADWHAAIAVRNAAQKVLNGYRDTYSAKVAAVTAANRNRTAAQKTLTAAKAKKPKDQAAINAAQTAYNAADAAVTTAEGARDAQRRVVDAQVAVVAGKAAIVDQAEKTNSTTYAAKVAASKAAKDDGGAFTLLWWEAQDCGDTIASLSTDYSIEWYESHEWNADRSGFITTVNVASPRVGRRRTDLLFEQGRNIMTVLPVGASDDYANTMFGIGAGEGVGSIRRETAIDDGRIRRMGVNTAKDVKSSDALDTRNRAQLATRMQTREIGSIEVRGTRQVPIGSWQVGDDIRIDGIVPWIDPVKPVKLWHRVTAWQLTGENTATLTLRRSNAYSYGG